MSNKIVQIRRVPALSFMHWIVAAVKMLWQNPAKLLVISLSFLSGFIAILGLSTYLYTSSYGVTAATFIISLIFPLTLSGIAAAYQQFEHHQVIQLKRVYSTVFGLANLRLILVYVLLVMFCSFASNYIFSTLEVNSPIVNYGFQCIFILLQFIVLIAVPGNMYFNDEIRPFRVLFIALKAMLVNIIPCFIFVVSIFIILIVAILLAKYLGILIGKAAILFYILELWVFVTWLSLSAIIMTRAVLDL